MDGILGIDKPAGLTSFDVVARLRRISHEKRIGHTGTLDPDATGVLVICFGAATRLSSRLMESRKGYSAELFLGRSTETADASGRTVHEDKDFEIESERFIECLKEFQGDILQIPPMYSAIKMGGRKLYELARAGEYAERTPRSVTIHSLRSVLPEGRSHLAFGDTASLLIECSAGTYIRTLCEDIGSKLGIPSHMSRLRRTYASGYEIDECISLDAIERLGTEDSIMSVLRPIEDSLPGMPRVLLSETDAKRATFGNEILSDRDLLGDVMLVNPSGIAIAIAEAVRITNAPGKCLLKPRVVFRCMEVELSNVDKTR